jgi:2-phosphoglycerate kinase
MIYLIGGSPRSGKTLLAKRLSARLRIGWVSIDVLESIVREYTPKESRQRLFPKNVLRKRTHGSNDGMYEKFSAREIVNAYIRQGKASYKAIEAFVSDCVYEAHDFVLEGYQIQPGFVVRLMERFPKEIQSCFLVKKDEHMLVDGFQKKMMQRVTGY